MELGGEGDSEQNKVVEPGGMKAVSKGLCPLAGF